MDWNAFLQTNVFLYGNIDRIKFSDVTQPIRGQLNRMKQVLGYKLLFEFQLENLVKIFS